VLPLSGIRSADEHGPKLRAVHTVTKAMENRAARYRNIAAEVRARADNLPDELTRQHMLMAAEVWDRAGMPGPVARVTAIEACRRRRPRQSGVTKVLFFFGGREKRSRNRREAVNLPNIEACLGPCPMSAFGPFCDTARDANEGRR
jgi:hypothetical protein